MKMLLVLVASWLVLARSASVVPEGDGGERPPPPSEDLLQEEISLDEMPREFLLQQEIVPELPPLDQREVDLPVLLHGEPQVMTPLFTPRGRPGCTGFSCSSRRPPLRVGEFPLGRPTAANIDNICAEGRNKLSYGPWNLPQTAFSHLKRQGEAINDMEAGFGRCCRQPGNEKLSCSLDVWSDALNKFCSAEFSVKTKVFHCCKKAKSATRERCFVSESPFPNYDFKDTRDGDTQGEASDCASGTPSGCKTAEKLPAISFPPGEPSDANIKNICQLRKFRPYYSPNALPQTGFGWFERQARAVNRIESEFKKCCRKEDASCARKGWEKALSQFCKQELSVKTSPHHCCKEEGSKARDSCFALQAPYPAYDKEIRSVNLAEISPSLLEQLCGQFKLLTKQRQIPALVQNITQSCCELQGDKRTQCAEQEKSQFVSTLCHSQGDSWKDTKKCCSQAEGVNRSSCFDFNYLGNVSMASPDQPFSPTEPAL